MLPFFRFCCHAASLPDAIFISALFSPYFHYFAISIDYFRIFITFDYYFFLHCLHCLFSLISLSIFRRHFLRRHAYFACIDAISPPLPCQLLRFSLIIAIFTPLFSLSLLTLPFSLSLILLILFSLLLRHFIFAIDYAFDY